MKCCRATCVGLIAAFGLLISGCFEVEEFVKVGADGITSLAMKIRLGMTGDKKPEGGDAAGKKLGELGEGMTGVRIKGVKAEQKDGQLIVSVEAEADHLTALEGFYRKASGPAGGDKEGTANVGNIFAKGSFYRVKKSGNKIRVYRTILPVEKLAKKKDKAAQAADEMAKAMFGSIFMRFSLKLPGKIIAHNAETLDGQTLTWIYPMSFLSKQKVDLWAEVEATPEAERALLAK